MTSGAAISIPTRETSSRWVYLSRNERRHRPIQLNKQLLFIAREEHASRLGEGFWVYVSHEIFGALHAWLKT